MTAWRQPPVPAWRSAGAILAVLFSLAALVLVVAVLVELGVVRFAHGQGCTVSTYVLNGKLVQCTTCCAPSGCVTSCNGAADAGGTLQSTTLPPPMCRLAAPKRTITC